jgi:hypothetical protein
MMKTHNCNFKVFVSKSTKCPDCKYALFQVYKCNKCPKTTIVKHICRGMKKRR